jgi:hypothetical protein
MTGMSWEVVVGLVDEESCWDDLVNYRVHT